MLGKESNERRERENVELKAEMQKEIARMGKERFESGKPKGIFKEGKYFELTVPTLRFFGVLMMQGLLIFCRGCSKRKKCRGHCSSSCSRRRK
jgi:hypothetical protein